MLLRFFWLPKSPVEQAKLVMDGRRIRHVVNGLFKSRSRLFQFASGEEHFTQLEHDLAVARVDTLGLTVFALRGFVLAVLSIHDAQKQVGIWHSALRGALEGVSGLRGFALLAVQQPFGQQDTRTVGVRFPQVPQRQAAQRAAGSYQGSQGPVRDVRPRSGPAPTRSADAARPGTAARAPSRSIESLPATAADTAYPDPSRSSVRIGGLKPNHFREVSIGCPVGSFRGDDTQDHVRMDGRGVLREDSSRQRSSLGEIALAKRRVGLLEYTIRLQADRQNQYEQEGLHITVIRTA